MSERLSAEDREALGDWWDSDWPDTAAGALGTLADLVEAILTARLAVVGAERDSAQEHLAYHLQDFRPGVDMEATGDLAVDMAAYARRLQTRLAELEALAAEWLSESNGRRGPRLIPTTTAGNRVLAALHRDPSEAEA